jgi:hypothetical protein
MRSRFVGLCGLLCVSLAFNARAAGERDEKEGAQKTFEAASKLYDTKHYEQALTAFRASYQILTSPNSHLMVARCLRELNRNVEAYREFNAVLNEAKAKGDRYESAAHAAQEEMDEVKQRLALVTIRVTDPPEGLVVKMGDKTLELGTLGAPLPVDPGNAVFTAEAPNGATARSEVALAAGTTPEVVLTLVAPEAAAPAAAPAAPPPPVAVDMTPPPAPSSLRTWAYVSGGVGVAGLATFAILGSMSSSKYSSLQKDCPNGHCTSDRQSDIDSGKQFQTFANVGLALGVVGVGLGTTLFIVSSGKKESAPKTGSVRVDLGVGSVSMHGVF